MGRPKKHELRCKQLNLSLTESELESISRRAEAFGLRPVQFGRLLILDREYEANAKTSPHNKFDRLVYGQLVRLGVNLNQMMRYLHRTGDPLPADLEPLLADIRSTIARMNADDR